MLTSLIGKMNISTGNALFSSVKRTFSYGQSTVSRLFELYIFLYFAIYEEDTDFRSHIFAYICQRVEICDSQNAESAKCQKRV